MQDIKKGTIITNLARVRVRLDDVHEPPDLIARGWSDRPVIVGEEGAYHLYMHTGRFVNVSRRFVEDRSQSFLKADYLSIHAFRI